MMKRKQTLFKKCHELAVKSDAEVCMICVSGQGEIEAWPSHVKATNMLAKNRSSKKKMKRVKKVSSSSSESLMTLMEQIESKIEAVDEKINMISSLFGQSIAMDGGIVEAEKAVPMNSGGFHGYGTQNSGMGYFGNIGALWSSSPSGDQVETVVGDHMWRSLFSELEDIDPDLVNVVLDLIGKDSDGQIGTGSHAVSKSHSK